MSQALGDFALPRALPAHLIFLCAGTGITPLLSMVRSLVEREHRGEMTFVQYAASDGGALYRHELAELALRCPNLRVLHVSTDETDSAVPINGLFSPAHLAAIEPDLSRAHVMACGPTALLDSIGAALAEQHLADRLTVESFAPPTVPDAIAADAAGLVRFARSETSAETRGETLLELAEANGLTPKYGCRMGICHTCTTPMTSGAVRDIRTGRVCAEPGTRVQICVSVPVADTELDL